MLSEKDTVSAALAEAVEPPVSLAVAVLWSGWPAAGSRVTARFRVQFQRRQQRLGSTPLSAANSSQIKQIKKRPALQIFTNKLASG